MNPITVAGSFTPGSPNPTVSLPVWFYITFADDVGTCDAILVISAPATTLVGTAGDAIPFAFDDLATAIGTTSSRYHVYSFGGGKNFHDTLSIFPPADVASGIHSRTLTLSLYENGALIAQGAMTVTLNVLSSCTLPPPDVSSLDFTPAVSQGRISANYTQVAVIHGASCTGAGKLTLSGTPMTTDAPPSAAYANQIDYRARATMASSTATLSTPNQLDATITVPPGAASLSINVSPLDGGRPLTAGRYASTLHVTLQPAN